MFLQKLMEDVVKITKNLPKDEQIKDCIAKVVEKLPADEKFKEDVNRFTQSIKTEVIKENVIKVCERIPNEEKLKELASHLSKDEKRHSREIRHNNDDNTEVNSNNYIDGGDNGDGEIADQNTNVENNDKALVTYESPEKSESSAAQPVQVIKQYNIIYVKDPNSKSEIDDAALQKMIRNLAANDVAPDNTEYVLEINEKTNSSLPITPIEKDEASGNISWEVANSHKVPITKICNFDLEEYDMHHENRGLALIFNHQYFENRSERIGTHFDRDRLEHTFESLKFAVKIHDDCSRDEVMEHIKEAASKDHTQSDCIAIAILTHGSKGSLHARDETYELNTVLQHFTAGKCPTLAGKPKLIFIQACRGEALDLGAHFSLQSDGGYRSRLPIYADFFIAHSTVPGYISVRDIRSGSWFIQTLCAELENYDFKSDLETLLTTVRRRVALNFPTKEDIQSNEFPLKQIPCVYTTLMRKLFFK